MSAIPDPKTLVFEPIKQFLIRDRLSWSNDRVEGRIRLARFVQTGLVEGGAALAGAACIKDGCREDPRSVYE